MPKRLKNLLQLSLFVFLLPWGCLPYKKLTPVSSSVSKDSVVEKSEETDYKDFFQRRMNNDEINKLKGSRCEVLKEDIDYIYFGYPIDSVVMNPLKVRKESLAGIFPKFAEIEGFHVKQKIYEQIIEPKEPKGQSLTNSLQQQDIQQHHNMQLLILFLAI